MVLPKKFKEINVGVDIESIYRFSKLSVKKNKFFFDLIYTLKEMEYCFSKADPYPHLAARFAGKEAVIKAVRGFGKEISPREIEILVDDQGAPVVNLGNKKVKNINVLLSLSHCRDRAIALALGVKNGNHK